MHIALFSPAWPIGRHPNGIVTYVNALTTEMRAQGHRVSIVSPEVAAPVQDPDVHPVGLGLPARIASAMRIELLDGTPTIFRYGKAIASVFAPRSAL